MFWIKTYQINSLRVPTTLRHQLIVEHSLSNCPDSFKRVFGFFCVFLAQTCELANFRVFSNLQTCKLANFWIHDSIDRTCESHLSIALVSRTCESHLLIAFVSRAYLIALVSRAYLNRTFESRFPIALSIARSAKLTLRACERAQVPFNVWAYLSVRFKPQEK